MQRQLLVLFLIGLFYVETLNGFQCLPSYYKCKTEVCVSSLDVCDGELDCPDGSDEDDCDKPLSSCKENEYQCKDHFHCITMDEFCDNKKDCIDGSDEYEDCHLNKNCTAFKCKNHHCITENWVCDGTNDCGDNSDELNCDKLPVEPQNCNNTIGKYLCANKRCIPLSFACNGKDDCGDDSDENPAQCSLAQQACNTTYPCQGKCFATPKGYMCSCDTSYVLKNDGTCEDLNECQEYGICSQICHNTIGSYHCQCVMNYELQDDGRSCKAKNGEALMIFASKTKIHGYYLTSRVYFPIAEDLQHVVGVSFDSKYIYWSDIYLNEEAIFRSLEDGSEREMIVTAGLGCPEDIAVDWVTGNIYFTDSTYKRVGVCDKDGSYCTVIITEATEKPRGIALLPTEGKLYWSDWGQDPHISVADMDGAHRSFFIKENIHWPNGLTIDYPSQRLYWVDAKLKVIESIQLDGQDRRTVLHDVTTHPYSIAIFENRLYWSDWSTNNIHSCDKFTGKDFETLFHKAETLYGIHIYHSSLREKIENPCTTKPCSQLCLLGEKKKYTCACTLDMELNEDQHTCKELSKQKHLAIAAGNTIIDYYHEFLGKPKMKTNVASDHISAMTYDSLTGTIIAADQINLSIFRYNAYTGLVNHIIPIVNEIVQCLAFDYFGNNLYRSNTVEKKIVVHSLITGEKTEFLYTEIPYDMALVPEEGLMFVVFRSSNDYHIDKAQMNGLGSRTHVVEHGLVGPKISIVYDADTKRVFWADEGLGRIESIDIQGQSRHLYQVTDSPVSIAILETEIFWTVRKSNRLRWQDKSRSVPGIKGINLDVSNKTIDILYLQTISGMYNDKVHICRKNNGDCSHICLVTDSNKRLCACPTGFVINPDQKTCRQQTSCTTDEIKCNNSDKCIKHIQICNGIKDCPEGEDENCPTLESSCRDDEFTCHNGECIKKLNRCDSVFNCVDHSDEENCDGFHVCKEDEFHCRSGGCIKKQSLCNGINDCDDFSDEEYCDSRTCDAYSFKCKSGACIPRNWECDGQIDCNDESDEHKLCKPSECANGMFSCKNGHCIDILLKCNGFNDCNDNSDEVNCPVETKFEALICTKDQYRCRNSIICIHNNLRCNGQVDCPEHDDEHGCGRCLPIIQFTCHNNKCIPFEWTCDHENDCGDNSDELQCNDKSSTYGPHPTVSSTRTNCSAGMYSCYTGQCLPLDLVCDGKKNCLDGSDEGGVCDEDICDTSACDNICHKTPLGPVCSCHEGYKLTEDGKSCVDIDECQKNICSQLCVNQPGSYSCSCFEGFARRMNSISCKAIGPIVEIITATKDDIRIMSSLSSHPSVKIAYGNPGIEITGLDVNTRESAIYWSNENLGVINKIYLKTNSHISITNGVGRPETLAVDWITDNVYYFDNEPTSSIRACNVEAGKCSQIVEIGENNNKVTAIGLDPLNETLFWSQVTWKIYVKPTSKIRLSNLVGGNVETIIDKQLGLVTGLAVDHRRSTLCWADSYLNKIECANYDGNKRTTILASHYLQPIGLNLYEDSLYWKTEIDNGILSKRELYGDKKYDALTLGSANIKRLFVVSQISRQPTGPNKCKNFTCNHLCIIQKGEPMCICSHDFQATQENGIVCWSKSSDNENVLSSKYNGEHILLDNGTIVTHIQPQETTGRQNTRTFTGLAITLFIFALMFSVYFYLKKKRPGFFKKRDLSIRFQNPSFARRTNNNASITSTSSILVSSEHEFINPIAELSNSKLHKLDNGSKKRLEIPIEGSDGETDEASTTYPSRLIH